MCDFGRLIKRMGIRRKYLFLLLLRTPFDALRTWMLANLMKAVFRCLETEKYVTGQKVSSNVSGVLLEICVVYGLISFMLFAYNGTIWSKYAAFSAKAEAWLQKEMLEKILSLPFKRVDCRSSGEWITKLNSDIQAAFTMMNGPLNIPHLVVAVINTILASFLMFRSSPLLWSVTWIFVLAQLFFNYKIVLEPIPKFKEAAQNIMSENTSAIKPLITDADTILLYDAKELMLKNCEKKSRKLMKMHMKMHVRNALNDVGMRLFGIGGYLVILFLGYKFIYNGTMAFSDVVYCFQIRGSIMAGMFMFLTCINNLKANSVCIKRLNDTFEE